jgi:hypothetical protein
MGSRNQLFFGRFDVEPSGGSVSGDRLFPLVSVSVLKKGVGLPPTGVWKFSGLGNMLSLLFPRPGNGNAIQSAP